MLRDFRTVTVAGMLSLAMTAAMSQTPDGDTGPGLTEKFQALQAYVEDESAVIVAQACAESMPDFMSKFLPVYTSWRAANAKQISLGSLLSVQFKGPSGEPMNPSALGRAAAERARAASPEERSRICSELLGEFGSSN